MINLPQMQKSYKKLTCPAGNRKKPLYKYEYDENLHCPRRVKNGEMDLADFIQASADDVDFKSIGKMLVDTRDNVIDHFKMEGETLDITALPRNIHEYELLHNKMKANFDGLPSDMKVLFQNDFEIFSRAWKNGSITQVLSKYYAKPAVVPTGADPVQKESEGDK